MQLTECPQCHSKELPAYLDRHMARHARIERNAAEARDLDARMNARYGRVRPVGTPPRKDA